MKLQSSSSQFRVRQSSLSGGAGEDLFETSNSRSASAFTLIEVMIALMIFFMAVFAILQLTSQNLRAARSLKQSGVSASMLAAELSLTNSLTEGMDSGDFGDMYPGYQWMREITMESTNGLYRVEFAVLRPGKSGIDSQMSILLYRPSSTIGPRTGLRTRSKP